MIVARILSREKQKHLIYDNIWARLVGWTNLTPSMIETEVQQLYYVVRDTRRKAHKAAWIDYRAAGQENDIAFSVSSRGDCSSECVFYFIYIYIYTLYVMKRKKTPENLHRVTPTDDQWHGRTIAYIIYTLLRSLRLTYTLRSLSLYLSHSGSGSLLTRTPSPPCTSTLRIRRRPLHWWVCRSSFRGELYRRRDVREI